MPGHNEEFDQIIQGFDVNTPTENIDTNPYGAPDQQAKPGLTMRGKVALGIGAAVVVGGSLIGYQLHEDNSVKEQEIALKAQQIQLQKLEETNRASEADQKTQATQSQTRQASIDSCVKNHTGGSDSSTSSFQDVVNACQAQYGGTTVGANLQNTAATQSTSSGSVNQGVLIGGGALMLVLVAAVKKGTRSNQA